MPAKTLAALLAGAALAGCMPMNTYHTARTLGEGESAVGLTFTTTSYQQAPTADDPTPTKVTLPGIIPEITYHIGMDDNLELGGRLAPGFLYGELDVKYRFLKSEKLHLAVAPALGQMAFVGTVTTVRFPLLLTYELSPRVAFNMGVTSSSWVIGDVPEGSGDNGSPFSPGDKFFQTGGVSLGLEITGRTAFFRPIIEYTSAILGVDDGEQRFELTQLALQFGWVSGREMKKLEEMDNKLDRIENKVSEGWSQRWKPAASE